MSATTILEPPTNDDSLRIKALRERHRSPSSEREELEGLRGAAKHMRLLLTAAAAQFPDGLYIPDVTLRLVEEGQLSVQVSHGYTKLTWSGSPLAARGSYTRPITGS